MRGYHTCDIQYPSCTSSSRRPEPISGNQWQSAAISGNQRQSVAISGNQWQSVALTCDIQYPSCTSSSMRPDPGPSYALAFPSLRALACATSRAKSGLPTTARAAAVLISISGPLAKATGPVHGSSGLVCAPVAEQLRQPFLRRVREAPAERPKSAIRHN
jgi:hypothetical protein